MATKNRNRNKSIQVLERCCSILEEIVRNNGEASLLTLGKRLPIPRSTIHRILSSLMELGYIEQNQNNGYYHIGLKVLFLSSVILENLDIRKVAQPFLQNLMGETGETANLVVLDRDEVVYIEKVESRAVVRVFSLIGHRAPVHATGAGKILISEMSQQDIINILRSKGMPKLTMYSVTTIEVLISELEIVRKQGFAYDNEECELGARCIAVPVRNHTGSIVASMSISGPTIRMSKEKMTELVPVIKKYAEKLSCAIGFSKELFLLNSIERD